MSNHELLNTLAVLDLGSDSAALKKIATMLFSYLPSEYLPVEWFCSPDTSDKEKKLYLSSFFPDSLSGECHRLVSSGRAKGALSVAKELPGVNPKSASTIRKYLNDPNFGLALCLVFTCPEAEEAVASTTLHGFSDSALQSTEHDPTEAERALRTIALVVRGEIYRDGDHDIDAIRNWVKNCTKNKDASAASAKKAAAIARLAKLLLLCPPSEWTRNADASKNNLKPCEGNEKAEEETEDQSAEVELLRQQLRDRDEELEKKDAEIERMAAIIAEYRRAIGAAGADGDDGADDNGGDAAVVGVGAGKQKKQQQKKKPPKS